MVKVIHFARIDIRDLILITHHRILSHQHIQHPPILRIIPRNELNPIAISIFLDVILSIPIVILSVSEGSSHRSLWIFLSRHPRHRPGISRHIHRKPLISLHRIPILINEPPEILRHSLTSPLGKSGIICNRSLWRTRSRNHDRIHLKLIVIYQRRKILLDPADLITIISQTFIHLIPVVFKLHITGSIGRHLPLDHLCHIPFGSVHKGTQRTDVICQRLAFRDVVYLHILLINLSRQHHIHLPQTRSRCQCVRIHISEIPVDLTHYRIKPEALLDRHLHILPEPFLLPGLPTFIRGFSQSVRIMFYSLLLRHSKRRSELRIRNESRISPESI